MFKKLLSNLPFSPSLLGQLSFYARRLRREEALRRTGLIMLSLAFALQFFAFISPPEPSIANSNNDLISGGVSSAGDAANHCNNNTGGYRDILAYYGITCDNVASARGVSLTSNDYGAQLYSMGRIAYGKPGETPVNIAGSNYYLRYLWSWDPWGSWSTYSAIQGTSSTGTTFFILLDCANLVFIGIPPAAPPPQYPPPVCEGWYLGWGFWYRSPDGDVNKMTEMTTKDPCALYPPPVCEGWYEGWGFWYQSPDGNVNLATKTTTVDPCAKPPDPPKPVCKDWYLGWGFWYQSPDGDVNKLTKKTTVNPCETPPPTTPPEKCPEDSSLLATDPKCKPCEKSQTREDKTPCLVYTKRARNDTQNIADAHGTTATANDTITYTLNVKNDGKVKIDDFVVQENISDILDYAEVVNLNGATKDAQNIISWSAEDIKAGATISKTFTVRVKNPIPQTPVSASDPGHFDLTMTNVYGNTINIKLPGTVIKTTEIVTTKSLPNTGPGETIAIAFTVTLIAGYFFARTRLMAKEVEIARAEYVNSGGQ